ncbi:hypothetical protein EK21DRAFT_101187 [Setomelanomma holmii]|uniref:Heterokaryon incompatibility domain-containing protein n=1 Tax=Setomelanomma holmii TaxID=210430 RepID=A0A9P4H782_9PLEO|nr:hypothetical protein EK21DRAFT_101187 [Setomelanomma holmii]
MLRPSRDKKIFHALFYDEETFLEYEALSYTWGHREKPCNIILNRKRMYVTRNLYEARWDLRYAVQDRILWVDALCINQRNPEQRGHQAHAMSTLCRLEAEMNNHAWKRWSISRTRWSSLWNTVIDSLHGELISISRAGPDSLLTHSWFGWVWIIQEVANARAARITVGKSSVSAQTFCVMICLAEVHVTTHNQAILDVMPGPARSYSWWTQGPDILVLLCKFRQCQASDPRDRLYGLLGAVSHADGSRKLVADYQKSELQVIRMIILSLLGADTSGTDFESLN